MGAFVLIALLLEGFSVDSFGLPYLWFSLGLLSAGSRLLPANTQPKATSSAN
jgi:hypothetical protein